jgi:hypothetical protein
MFTHWALLEQSHAGNCANATRAAKATTTRARLKDHDIDFITEDLLRS